MAKKTSVYLAAFLLIVFAAIAIVAVIAVGTYTSSYSIPEGIEGSHDEQGQFVMNHVVKYPSKANVTVFNASDSKIKVGVASQTYELNFGIVPKTVQIRKFLNLTNNEGTPLRACISAKGNISPYIEFTQGSDIVIPSGEYREVEVLFNATDVGSYEGDIYIVIRKPRYDLMGYSIGLVKC